MYRTSPQFKSLIGVLIFAIAGAASAADYSAPTVKANKPSGIDAARHAIETSDYPRAIEILTAEAAKAPRDADVQNLLGYSNRKLKRYGLALSHYQKALELQPNHRGANNYVGHLYLETGRLDRAQERLAVLDKECTFGCKEYSDLRQAIAAHQQEQVAGY
ncbi:Tetratricopeptide repeat protein [compost metagenome]